MIHFISLESYYSDNSIKYINSIIKNSLYITASSGIKKLRVQNIDFKNSNCTFNTFNYFIKEIKNAIKQYGGYITIRDQMFILYNTIKDVYKDSPRGLALYNIKKQIYDLFYILIDKKIEHFDEKLLDLIQIKSNDSTAELFSLYNIFIENLKNIQDGNNNEFLLLDNLEGKFPLYQTIINKEMAKAMKNRKCLIMEGFLFLTLEEKQLIKNATELGKDVYLITKRNEFTNKNIYIPLMAELCVDVNYIDISGREVKKENCISIISDNLYGSKKIEKSIDDSVLFIEPFVSREEEYKFIVKDILKYLEITCGNDKEKIKNALDNDIAIMIRKKEDTIYFNDLLTQLNAGFKMSINDRSLLDFTLGQFIYNIYSIIGNGIDPTTYKKLLFIQWKYNENCNLSKYSTALKDFSTIEIYFKNLTSISEWLFELNKIIDIKNEIDTKDCYKFHPIRAISYENIDFLISHLTYISSLIEKLSSVDRTNREHIEILKDIFMSQENANNDKDSIEQIFSVIDSLNDNSMLKISSKFFSEVLRSMLTEYEIESNPPEEEICIYPINIENVTQYKRVYIPKFELGTYPQNINKVFPFTETILNILSDKDIGINYKIYDYIKNDYHFFFKNFLDFTSDTIIFTQAESENGIPTLPSIYIEDVFSLFNKDVEYIEVQTTKVKNFIKEDRTFVNPVLQLKQINLPNLLLYFVCPKMFYYLNNAETFCVEEIQLSLYAGSILYTRFFENFVAFNKDKVFYLDKALQSETEKVLNNTLTEITKVFDYLSPIELNDIYSKCLKQIYYFYAHQLRIGKFAANKFIFLLSETEIIKVDDYNIILDEKLIVKNVESNTETFFDFTRSLYFLVLSSGGKGYDLKHYSEIVE